MPWEKQDNTKTGAAARPLFAALLALGFAAQLSAGAEGEAFWGSFGEGAGRIEGVVFKSHAEAGDSRLLGYDDKSKTALYSAEIAWGADNRFAFESIAIHEAVSSTALGNGTVARAQGLALPASLMSATVEDVALEFTAFASTESSLREFRLSGSVDASLRVVVGEGKAYCLFIEEGGYAYGAPVSVSEEGDYTLLTPEGDVFSFVFLEDGSLLGAYELAEGSLGDLVEVDQDSESAPATIKEIWQLDSKFAGQSASQFYFYLLGEGQLYSSLEAIVSLSADAVGEVDSNGAAIGLYRVLPEGGYEIVAQSRALSYSRRQFDGAEEFNPLAASLHLEGTMDFIFSEGLYFVQLQGLDDVTIASQVSVAFDELDSSETPKLVNASTLYMAGRPLAARQLGFRVEGSGVAEALARNAGPSLEKYNVPSISHDPILSISMDERARWNNDDWWKTRSVTALQAQMDNLGAFEFDALSKDAAVSLVLGEGDYALSPQGNREESATELVEIYFE